MQGSRIQEQKLIPKVRLNSSTISKNNAKEGGASAPSFSLKLFHSKKKDRTEIVAAPFSVPVSRERKMSYYNSGKIGENSE